MTELKRHSQHVIPYYFQLNCVEPNRRSSTWKWNSYSANFNLLNVSLFTPLIILFVFYFVRSEGGIEIEKQNANGMPKSKCVQFFGISELRKWQTNEHKERCHPLWYQFHILNYSSVILIGNMQSVFYSKRILVQQSPFENQNAFSEFQFKNDKRITINQKWIPKLHVEHFTPIIILM